MLAILKLKPVISREELTYLLNMSKQSVAEFVTNLEKNGYITREPSEDDNHVMENFMSSYGHGYEHWQHAGCGFGEHEHGSEHFKGHEHGFEPFRGHGHCPVKMGHSPFKRGGSKNVEDDE